MLTPIPVAIKRSNELAELGTLVEVTVWSVPSWLIQVTEVPTGTVMVAGRKAKPLIMTGWGGGVVVVGGGEVAVVVVGAAVVVVGGVVVVVGNAVVVGTAVVVVGAVVVVVAGVTLVVVGGIDIVVTGGIEVVVDGVDLEQPTPAASRDNITSIIPAALNVLFSMASSLKNGFLKPVYGEPAKIVIKWGAKSLQ